MTLQEYFADKPRGSKVEMCKQLGITKSWLSLIITKQKKPGRSLALIISMYTDDQVPTYELLEQ